MDPAETGRDGDIGPLPLAAEEVIAQMNSGELSIGPAAVIAGQPKYAENEIRKDFTPEYVQADCPLPDESAQSGGSLEQEHRNEQQSKRRRLRNAVTTLPNHSDGTWTGERSRKGTFLKC
jgi:hypothetical protein